MALSKEDLQAIELIIEKSLKPLKADIKEMKADLKIIATLN